MVRRDPGVRNVNSPAGAAASGRSGENRWRCQSSNYNHRLARGPAALKWVCGGAVSIPSALRAKATAAAVLLVQYTDGGQSVAVYRLLLAFVIAWLALPARAHDQEQATRPAPDVIAHGRYIVEDVAVCGTCHTPSDQQGMPDEQRKLLGGPVQFRPVQRDGWAEIAPRIAGLPPGTDEQFITLMMTGISRTGHPLRPPMPQFRLTRSDSEAVLAYLKSLKSHE